MGAKQTITKNFIALLSSQIISSAISFVLAILIARYLGAEDFGKYSYAFAFANIVMIFTDFGVNTYVIREVAKFREKTAVIFGNCLLLKLLFSAMTLIGSMLFIFFTESSFDMAAITMIATAAMLIYYLGGFYRTLLMAYEIMEYESIISIIEKVFLFLAVFAVISKNLFLFHIVIAFFVVYIIAFLMRFFIVAFKIGLFSFKFSFGFTKSILKTSFPFWMSGIFIMLFYKIDSVMLKIFQDYTSVGIYNAASKLTEGLGFLPVIMVMAVFPAMSRLHLMNKESLLLLYRKSVGYLFMIILPISIGTTILASRIIPFIYKNDFTSSSIVLQILIWAELIIFINYIIGYLLNSIDMQKFFTIAGASCALFNIILNLFLIPSLSYIGAAISTLISQSINLSLLYYFSSRKGYSLHIFSIIAKPIAASAIMAASIFLMMNFNLLIIVPSAACAYFISLLLMRHIGKEEFSLIKSIFNK